MIGLRKILVSACVGLILDIGCCARALAVVSTSSGTLSSKLNLRPREDQDEDIGMTAQMKRGLTSTSSSSSRRKSTTRPGRFLMRTLLGRKAGRALTALALASALQHSGPSDGQSPGAGGLLPVAEAGNLPVVGSRGITQFVYGGSEDFVEPGADSAHGKGALGGLRIKNVSVKGIWLFTNFCAAPLSILSAAVSGVVRGKMLCD